MTQIGHTDLVDDLTADTLRELCTLGAPCVSVFLPTHRAQPDLVHDSLVLRGLLDEAEAALSARGSEDPGGILRPLRDLVDDRPFWAYQGDGLAVFAAPGTHAVLKLPAAPATRVHVGDHPLLSPLIPVVAGDASFHLLALSLGQVRLFTATRDSIAPMDLGPVPASLADMERRSDREPQLQHQHTPPARGSATFHGHGGADVDDVARDHFIREVAAGLRQRLGAASRTPVVLAAVAEYLPPLLATGQLPTLLDEVVPGNPEHRSPADLLDAAWPLVEGRRTAHSEALRAEAAERVGTGRAVTDPAQVAHAATLGRIDTLLLRTDAGDADLLDLEAESVCAASATGAALGAVPGPLPGGASMVGFLRY